MEERDKSLVEQYGELMHGYEPQQFISNVWPLENGVYRQYSAFESSGTVVSGTSFSL